MGSRFLISALAVGLGLTGTRVQAALMYATSGNDIARFDSGATGVVTSLPVTGLHPGESLISTDVRPANHVLYGVGSSGRVSTIRPNTGVATAVNTTSSFTANGTTFPVDFNPVPARIRVISNTGQNLRLNP